MLLHSRCWGVIASTLMVGASITGSPGGVAQPPEPTTLAGILARVEARGNPAEGSALDAAQQWVARYGDIDLPLTNVNRAIEYAGTWPPECVNPVAAFEINAQPSGPDIAAMIYNGPWRFSWEPVPDPPGVLSPFSGVRFIFVNIEQQFIGEVPWEWTGTRTIPAIPLDRAFQGNFPIRFSQLTEFGGGTVVGLFVGQDIPTNGPQCPPYSRAVVANGDSTGCSHFLCPSGYPYNRYPPPYG